MKRPWTCREGTCFCLLEPLHPSIHQALRFHPWDVTVGNESRCVKALMAHPPNFNAINFRPRSLTWRFGVHQHDNLTWKVQQLFNIYLEVAVARSTSNIVLQSSSCEESTSLTHRKGCHHLHLYYYIVVVIASYFPPIAHTHRLFQNSHISWVQILRSLEHGELYTSSLNLKMRKHMYLHNHHQRLHEIHTLKCC